MKIVKLANAFFEEAEPIRILGGAAKRAVSRYKKKYKGLWVGGKITISDTELVFIANGLNRALHEQLPEVKIRINEINSVTYEFGWFTGIIAVAYSRGEFRFRCFGAKRLAHEFNRFVQKR